MRTLQTKEARTNLLKSIIERRTSAGYTLETYKGLQILTKKDGERFILECYKDNSTNPILNFYYRNEAQMMARIEQTKQSYDIREEYKAKRKAEQNGRLTGAASCADAIRSELKAVFPWVKFSVRSSTFSGGDSVSVSWQDGPTVAEVSAITSKYQRGSFNGMEDIYEYTNSREDIPQAKWVSEERTMSEESRAILTPLAENLFNSFGRSDAYNCRDFEQFLHRVFYACSFPKGAKVTGIVSTGETCGLSSPEVFYKLSFDVPQTEKVKEVAPIEVKPGKLSVIEYGRGLAVVGDTKPIKDKLKAAGGRFNPHLSCGAGWVFPMSKLEELKKLLNETAQKGKKEVENIEKPVIVTEEATEQAKNYAIAIQSAQKTLPQAEQPQEYSTLQEITEAAKSGKVVSLYNLSQLVNA